MARIALLSAVVFLLTLCACSGARPSFGGSSRVTDSAAAAMSIENTAAEPAAPSPSGAAGSRSEARAHLSTTTANLARWFAVVAAMLGLALLVLSFTPFGVAFDISRGEALSVLGVGAGAPLAAYFIAVWGGLAADAAGVVVVVGVVVGGVAIIAHGYKRVSRWARGGEA